MQAFERNEGVPVIEGCYDGMFIFLALELQPSGVHVSVHRYGLFFPSQTSIRDRKIAVWTPAFAPCFRIIREESKFKKLRNADKFQARVSKIRKALAETSTRPVTFHEEVCLGEDDVSRGG